MLCALGALLAAAAAGAGAPSSAGPAATGPVRVPAKAQPLALVWRGSFAGTHAFAATLEPGADHEAEGPSAIAAGSDGFAVLDTLAGLVRFHDAAGAPVRALSLAALGAEGASATDLALDDAGGAAVLLARGGGAVAWLDASGAVSARAELSPERAPATGLVHVAGALFAGIGDARAWQPLRPLEPIRLGLPSPGGDCNGALLGDGRAIVRCHGPSGLREITVEAEAAGAPIAAVELVHADQGGGLAAVLSVRASAGALRRLAFRADAEGTVTWAELGPDAPWFTHRGFAFTRDGQLLRLSGDAAGPQVLKSALRPLGAVTP